MKQSKHILSFVLGMAYACAWWQAAVFANCGWWGTSTKFGVEVPTYYEMSPLWIIPGVATAVLVIGVFVYFCSHWEES